MHQITLDKLVANKADALSPSQRNVARYVLEHPDHAVFLSSAELGSRVGVSESTVIRLAGRLGFDGFPEMQRQLQNEFRDRIGPAERLARTTEESGADLFNRIIETDVRNLRETASAISPSDFQRAVELTLAADHIYTIGLRRSYPLSYTCAFFLNQVLGNADALDLHAGGLPDQLARLSKNDVLIAISLPRYAALTVEVARAAQQIGCPVVAITDSVLSPLAPLGDVVLLVRCETIGPLVSNVAATSMLTAVGVAAALQRRDDARQRFARLDELAHQFGLQADDHRSPAPPNTEEHP